MQLYEQRSDTLWGSSVATMREIYLNESLEVFVVDVSPQLYELFENDQTHAVRISDCYV